MCCTLSAVTKSVGRCSLTPLAAALSTSDCTIFAPSSSNSDLPICSHQRMTGHFHRGRIANQEATVEAEGQETNVHAVENFLERERHATANDHFVNLTINT